MSTVIITGIFDTRNNGCWVMAVSIIRNLKKQLPKVDLKFFMNHDSVDDQRLSRENVEFFYSPWTRIKIPKLRLIYSCVCLLLVLINLFLLRFLKLNLFYRKFSHELIKSDLVVDLSGDSISKDYSDYSVLLQIFPLFCCAILKKPYCLLAQSIGPFKDNWVYDLVRFTILRAKFITAREQITYNFLRKIGYEKPMLFLTADSAFLLDDISKEHTQMLFRAANLKKDMAYIGVSISAIISQYFYNADTRAAEDIYVKKMASLCDSLIERHRCNLLFIPHVTIPGNDDRVVSNKVFNAMKHKAEVVMLRQEYLGSELKGFIGRCDILLTSRMHAAISALSQGVPVVAIAYNLKTYGVLGEMLNLKDWIIDIKEVQRPEFLSICENIISQMAIDLDSARKRVLNAINSANIRTQTHKNIDLCLKFLVQKTLR